MKISLQELIEQKALLEKHLGWINRKIGELKGEAGEGSASRLIEESDREELSTEPPSPHQDAVQSAPDTTEIATPEPELVGAAEVEVPPSEGAYEFSSPSSVAETKKGCLVITLVGAAIVIIIAVLVYMFYPTWDEEEARQKLNAPTEEESAR